MDEHDEAVASIAKRVRHFHSRQQQFRIYHGSTNSTRQSQYRPDNIVDTSSLTHVIKIDRDSMTALVEPNVPMDSLLATTLKYDLLPPVVMEFPGITVGGGFAGTGGESSSFKYGFFDSIVKSIEIVLANGDVVFASDNQNSDLFRGAASSFGTLGITTLLEIQLRPAKSYVELTYFPVNCMTDAVARIKQATAAPNVDFVDGVLFSKSTGVICVGKLTSEIGAGLQVQTFCSPKDQWFYLHAEKVYRKNSVPYTEVVPVTDYLFRYDRGSFWMGRYAYKYFAVPFNRATRWILDKFMHTRVLYHALHKSGHSKLYIIQDVAVPFAEAKVFVDYLDDNFGHYPLWLCPLLQTANSPMSPRALSFGTEHDSKMILNVGIWGPGPRGTQAFIDANRRLEQKVQELGGKKWLYAHAYYTEAEFWSIYDREQYDSLRAKYHATYLPSIYDKVKVDLSAKDSAKDGTWRERARALCWNIWPLSGVYAVLHTVFRSDYLLQKHPKEEEHGKAD